MKNKDESIKTNEDPNVEAFKFFEKTKNRKVSPKSNKFPKRPLFLFPLKRKTRLKSQTVETAHNLPDGEFDINKEDLDTTETSMAPLRKETNWPDNITSPDKSNFNKEKLKEEEVKNKKKVYQPMRRTTRLKTEIFVESFPLNSDDEGDTNKEQEPVANITSANKRLFSDLDKDECEKNVKRPKRRSARLKSESFHNTQDEEMDKSKDDFHKANNESMLPSINTPKDSMFSDSNVEDNDIHITINKIVGSLEDSTQTKSKKRKREKKSELDDSFEKMADNLLETIDTNVIVDMMQNTSLDSQKSEDETNATRRSKRTRRLTQSENCNGNFEKKNSNAKPRASIKNGTKSLVEMFEKVNGHSELEDNNFKEDEHQQLDFTKKDKGNTTKPKSPKKRGRKSLAEKSEEVNDQRKLDFYIVKDDQQQHLDFTNKDKRNTPKSEEKPKSPIKRLRKSLVEKCEEGNDRSKLDNHNGDKKNAKSGAKSKSSRISLSENYEEESEQNKLSNDLQFALTNDGNVDYSTAAPNLNESIELNKNDDNNVNNSLSDNDDQQINLTYNDDDQEDDENIKENNLDIENILQDKQQPQPLISHNDTILNSKTNEIPKKRGRKPRTEKSTTDANIAEQVPKVPKKRGRKPKNLNNVLKETGNNTDKRLKKMNKTTDDDQSVNDTIDSIDNDADVMEGRPRRRSRVNNNTADNISEASVDTKFTSPKNAKVRGKSKVLKVNVAKALTKNKTKKFSKLTKEDFKPGAKRKIPQKCLEEVLAIIDDEDHPIWEDRNISCNPSIYTYWQQRAHAVSEQNLKIKYARQFLLRRDWINMYKILSLFNTKINNYYPLMSKYAALLLAHTDAEQFNKYIQFLTSMVDSSAVLKKCTGMPKDH
ncbi:hypothetical protein FF38_07029 [Lucilia cuprina]|uniref:Uncharacterized protein n=1 Tax=Lucilia cuprina TaxID=7375 RepID=A0A0L0CP11_LUCCU|nr:hypothetical protein CVS40_9639 [Lucilia cuprina]KNC33194.1 hypothetical protein FF38_07029 [Lucilia cuprina]